MDLKLVKRTKTNTSLILADAVLNCEKNEKEVVAHAWPACAILTGEEGKKYKNPICMWQFKKNAPWVKVSSEETLKLLNKHIAEIPQWFEVLLRGFPLQGEGWKVIN